MKKSDYITMNLVMDLIVIILLKWRFTSRKAESVEKLATILKIIQK